MNHDRVKKLLDKIILSSKAYCDAIEAFENETGIQICYADVADISKDDVFLFSGIRKIGNVQYSKRMYEPGMEAFAEMDGFKFHQIESSEGRGFR